MRWWWSRELFGGAGEVGEDGEDGPTGRRPEKTVGNRGQEGAAKKPARQEGGRQKAGRQEAGRENKKADGPSARRSARPPKKKKE